MEPQQDRLVGRQRTIPRPSPFPADRQSTTFSPKFDRLAQVLQRDPTGLELRADPAALAPERLLVFEVRGAIGPFAAAVRRVPGLELIDEEELARDDQDNAPVAYLMVPDARALRELESLWRRWQRDALVPGETPWRDVFALLRDLRPWGPADRVEPDESNILSEEIAGRSASDIVRLEIELVYRANQETGFQREREVVDYIVARGGRLVSRARIDDIAYHALLVGLPVRVVQEIVDRRPDSIAGLEPIMHIRPQAVASTIELSEDEDSDQRPEAQSPAEPILALLDGVPVAAHPLLSSHLTVDDQFNLEPNAPVEQRIHGTAMASLIVHGDRNRLEPPLPRRIHVVPVLGAADAFPSERLVVDLVYASILRMREGTSATAPGVLIVNISLGNARRSFHGQLSPWARLLDRLAYRFGILFVVSAGNHTTPFGIRAYANSAAFEDAASSERATETLRALGALIGERRLLAPAEAVNGLTVGACNEDWVSAANRATARINVDPYNGLLMPNPSSALGPGFALSVKPDILMPGAREHLRLVRSHSHIDVEPARAARSAGLKVAAPPRAGRENIDGYTNGTSAAAALGSRLAHRIHDALEAAYGQAFLGLTHVQKAVLLKALVAHPARWPDDAASLIRSTIGPPESKFHQRQRDNVRRFLGFGYVDADDAIACSVDRATFWATGTLERDKASIVNVPVPIAMRGQARAHALFATLAWFTPTSPGRRSYRSVRLKLLEPQELDGLRLKPHRNQPDSNQTNRGTVFARCWTGDKAPVVGPDMVIRLTVQRDPDQNETIDEAVPFGLAVTLTMPGVIEIYEQVRQRLGIAQRARA